MPRFSWPQALAWRLRRQMLDPTGAGSVEDVVHRLGAIQAQSEPAAELSVRTRLERSRPGDVGRALADGRIIKTFAFRGATHLMTPVDAGVYLALRAASRMWELPSWQAYYRLTPQDWPAFRDTVREALADGPLTRAELGAVITATPRFRHLSFVFDGDAVTLLKPLAWQGDLIFGPSRDGHATFQRPDHNPRWSGIPDIDEAGMHAVEAYVRTYGPARPDHLQYWLGAGLGAGRRRIHGWIAAMGERLVAIDIDGESAFLLDEDIDDLAGTRPTACVRILPAYDQWLLGPGTADAHIVPSDRREAVSRGANVVIVGGRVYGTWTLARGTLAVDWFADAQARPAGLADEISRLVAILERPVESSIG